ncbi:MAG: ABC transporter permease, partial [Actinobacteria bacterium]|nr:ABC transporter permease [Actinomycetota bacterium]
MGQYVSRRLLTALPTLLGLSFLIFVLVSAAPGNPAEELARRRTQEATQADIDRARQELNLDRPLLTQYGLWLKGAVTGDLGESFSRREPVADIIAERVPATIQLSVAALALIAVLSLPLGMAAAVFHRRWPDQLLRLGALIGASIPNFFFAYLLIIFLVTRLGLLPIAGRDGLSSVVMPAIVLAVLPTAVVSRLLRSSLLEVMGEDYMRTARSKGVGGLATLVSHGLRNAAIPVITYLGTVLGTFLEGVVIVEFIFAWP